MVYLPTTHSVTVRLDKLSGAVKAYWFDPRTGAASDAGSYANSGTQSFTPPSNGPDWVLVLDDASQGFGAPGAR
jgi:hypothetical protein